MERQPEPFAIRRHGALSHSRGRIDGRLQEARILDVKDKDEGQFRPAPIKVIVRNGVRLAEPEIINYADLPKENKRWAARQRRCPVATAANA